MSCHDDESTLAFLASFQHRFSTLLRTPLDRRGQTLSASMHEYDEQLCKDICSDKQGSAQERLAVYHRQYWFRLFTVLQTEYRLTARLMSYWTFNDYASRFVLEHPPRSASLHTLADGFEDFLEGAVPAQGVARPTGGKPLPRAALREAFRIDGSFRRVLISPTEPALILEGMDPTRLAASRLRPAQSLTILEQHWPLLELRRKLLHDQEEAPVELPPPLACPSFWAVFRTDSGHGVLPLAPVQARLLQLLSSHPVADALALLEERATDEERQLLAHNAQRWLAESMRFGFWVGIETPLDSAAECAGGNRDA